MENGMFLHVGPPTIRLLPVELLLTPNRRPLVFRPKLSQSELEQLLRSLKSLIGQQYDTVRVYSFVARLALSSWFGARFPLTAKRLTGMDPLAQDLVYDNSTRLPIASVARAPSGEGSQPSREAEEIAERSRHKNGRVATIGGRYEEVVDETIFANPLKLSPSSSTIDDPSLPSSSIPIDSPPSNEAVICTDAILPRLLHASAEWRAALGIGNNVNGTPTPLSRGAAALRKKLDYFQLRSWSINDVFSFSALRPDLLTRIRLPPVHMPKEFADLDEPPSSSQSSNPNVMPIFDTKLWNSIDDYLARRHPDLRANSKHVEELLNQVYVTASPLFRSVVQLYSYTMKRLPVQLQTAIRIYIFLMTVRQVIRIWRGYVLVRSGVKVVTRVFKNGREKKIMAKEKKSGILHRLRRRSASHTPSDSSTSTSLFSRIRFYRRPTKLVANMVADAILTDEMRPNTRATNSPKSRWFGRSRTIQSACTGRSSSASSASVSSSQSPPASSSSSSSLSRTRSLSPSDHLDRILRHPEAHRLTDFLVDQLLPLPNQQASKILREMMRGIANSTSGGLSNQNDASLEPEDDGTSTLSSPALAPIAAPSIESSSASALDATFPSPSSVLSSPLSGRKRAALKSLAKTSASIAFPRLTQLVTFMRQELELSQVKKSKHEPHPSTSIPSPPSSSSSTPPITITGRTRSRSETRTSNPSSNDDGTAYSASAQSRSRSSSLSPSRSAQFAAAHPHLVSIFEQGKLLLLSALVAQFTDKIRSAL